MRLIKARLQRETNRVIRENQKQYIFVCPIKEIEVGDYVLVECKHGKKTRFFVALVDEILNKSVNEVMKFEIQPNSYVFCKLDIEDFNARMRQVKKMKYKLRAIYEGTYKPVKKSKKRLTKIEDASLSVRTYNCLDKSGIKYINELTKRTEKEVLQLNGVGNAVMNEIKNKLNELGISFKKEM